jgi:Tfp pilus assembly protein PilP
MIGEVIIAFFISNSVAQEQPVTAPAMTFGTPPPPAPAAPPPAPAQNQPPQNQPPPNSAPEQPPEAQPAPAPYQSPKLKKAMQEIEAIAKQRNKSPFMIPNDLYLKIKRKQREQVSENVIDNSADAKVRYPLRSYTLIGVFTGIKIPKALIRDRDGKVHTFRPKEFIANAGGYVSEIGSGEVIVVEEGAEVKLKIRKDAN